MDNVSTLQHKIMRVLLEICESQDFLKIIQEFNKNNFEFLQSKECHLSGIKSHKNSC